MITDFLGKKIIKELQKTKKLSHLRKQFLKKIKKAEYENDIKKEILFYSAQIRTLNLSNKIYQEFENFLKQELNNKTFNNLKITQNQNQYENQANLILIKFKEIFFDLTKPNGELTQLINIINNETKELQKYQNSPQTIQQKIKEMSQISAEEKIEEILENQIIEKIQKFLKETNLNETKIKNLTNYIKNIKQLPIQAGEKLEENASLFALTVVSLGLVSSIAGTLGLPGVTIFSSLFGSVAFGGELLQSIPFLNKKLKPIFQNFLQTHKTYINQLTKEKEKIEKIEKK